ncbi:MAG: ABC transporter ATP-binding protein [Halanaerobiales bacterium]
MDNETGVKLQNVTKEFGEVIAVNNIDLAVKKGELFALLGPSGCGKTTTLRLIAGLEEPTSGEIYIENEEVSSQKPKKRDIAMVFQDYALYPHMTVEENIGYPLKVRKVDDETKLKKVKETAGRFQIENLLDRRPNQLSGGQQQRVAVARAIVHKPRIFLFDEPLSNLDARLRIESRSFIKNMQHNLGVTTFYVTHDQAEALALADRIAVLKNGELRQVDTPRNIYENPADSFVANFIGDPPMNLVDCIVQREEGELKLGLAGQLFQIDEEYKYIKDILDPEQDYLLGIRPEHLKIKKNGALKGEIYAIETLGSETLVTVSMNNKKIRISINDPYLDYEIGESISFDFSYEMLRFYEKDSGKLVQPRG